MINSLLNRNRKKNTHIKLKLKDGTSITAPKAVADTFNNYFCNIASSLKAEIDSSRHIDYQKNLGTPVTNSIFLRDATAAEVGEYIKSLMNKSTSDTKVIALKALTNCNNLTEIFATILNTSLKEGVFPTQLKQAKIAPIYKSGNKTMFLTIAQYRCCPRFRKFLKRHSTVD